LTHRRPPNDFPANMIKYDGIRCWELVNMTSLSKSSRQAAIIRTERGLTISGTRLTLYEVMDFLKAQYPAKLIRDKFNLTNDQINLALAYIVENHAAIEIEYQQVLQTRAEIRHYWEDYNRERLAQIAAMPHQPQQAALWAKLEAQKTNRAAVQQ
jgi:uncharacterized protein (DUF433 family)